MAAYEESRIGEMEASVEAQCRAEGRSEYSAEQCRLLLKLYQFYPAQAKPQFVFKALAKALTFLPSSDFTASLFLVSESLVIFFSSNIRIYFKKKPTRARTDVIPLSFFFPASERRDRVVAQGRHTARNGRVRGVLEVCRAPQTALRRPRRGLLRRSDRVHLRRARPDLPSSARRPCRRGT